ncbi:putative short chain dehydrogenase reductase family protein [Parachaetomium inaequale]|uniref:Short chain dehydrogenase reductase family protein n=1 Tax=Parachaetomium inaequale TaxID=2588326 RepID=A0AAN6PCZ7_9PEZI|nr:putative short chain dehydrogenase reductase family protein [Parachaetomium inaequale]
MVSSKEIRASNALINDATAPRVSVFVGGTSGIGKLTIRALVATGASVRIYIVGRKSSEERTRAFIQELHALNPRAEVIWTEGEIALLADVKRVCEAIKAKEPRVDLLFLTAGYAPFGPRVETAEGIEIAQSLEYYSRILFVLHLLPLLGQAEAPRVVSVLGGGLERASSVDVDDVDLKKPGNFSGVKAQIQYTAMNSTALEQLASDNPNVTFVHSWPGWVNTGNVDRSSNPNSWTAWIIRNLLGPIVRLFAMRDDTSAQRNLFQSTSAAFGGRGVPWTGKPGVNTLEKQENGLFLVNFRCNCTPNAKVMSVLREKAREKVWTHTLGVLGPYM